MPKAYTDIKTHLLRKGFSVKEAEKHAAMIYNGKVRKLGEPPVTRNYEKTAATWKKKGGAR